MGGQRLNLEADARRVGHVLPRFSNITKLGLASFATSLYNYNKYLHYDSSRMKKVLEI
jgi:hypothetical protein